MAFSIIYPLHHHHHVHHHYHHHQQHHHHHHHRHHHHHHHHHQRHHHHIILIFTFPQQILSKFGWLANGQNGRRGLCFEEKVTAPSGQCLNNLPLLDKTSSYWLSSSSSLSSKNIPPNILFQTLETILKTSL